MPSRTWQHAAQHLRIPTDAPLRPLWALLPPLSNQSAMRSSTSQNLTGLLALSFSGLQTPLRPPLQFPASIHPLSFQFSSPGRQAAGTLMPPPAPPTVLLRLMDSTSPDILFLPVSLLFDIRSHLVYTGFHDVHPGRISHPSRVLSQRYDVQFYLSTL